MPMNGPFVSAAPDEKTEPIRIAWQGEFAGDAALEARYAGDADRPELVLDGRATGLDLRPLAAGWIAALRALLAQPATPLCELPLLGPEDAAAMRALGEASLEAARIDTTIDAHFAAVAACHAAQTALRWSGGTMDYATLARHVAALDAMLVRAAVAPGERVGLMLPRGPAAIVALLALLRRGAAYVPLDPSHPTQRLAYIAEDAGLTRVLVAPGVAMPVAGLAAIVVDLASLAAVDVALPAASHDAETAAYVLYTSGSTGAPKGVAVPHRAVLRLALGADYVALGPGARVLHAAPLGFDASTLEIWGPLLNGGCCVLHDEAVPTGPGLARTIRDHRVSAAWLTAALFNTIVDDDPSHLAGLSTLLTGGEVLSVPHLTRALAALPDTALVNGYGPTECTTFSTTWRLPRALPEGTTSVPIGRPVAGTRLRILGPDGRMLPRGAIGELWVGGAGVALGYVGRAADGAARFVADPERPGERLYRTGDRVHWLDDGTLAFVGRRDGQVKIRGFRIETGEIEAALRLHQGVRSAAVVAREDGGERRLVAYVVTAGASPGAAALREHLAARLPAFMLPAAFVELERLPLTANGKLDRGALPAPGRARPDLAVPYAAPRGSVEARIAAAFADLLGVDRVGRDDGFFELGGSSLLAVRAVTRLVREGLAGLDVTGFFARPTPAALAAQLAGSTHAAAAPRAPRARRDDDGAIAIIAMAGRFPGAPDVEALWQVSLAGRDTLTRFAPHELDPSIPASLRDDPDYVPVRGVLDGVDRFDAAFFGIPPREAELIDPQQRVFLELCASCLERGGYGAAPYSGPVGVFAGMYNASYFRHHVLAHPDKIAALGEFQVMLGNEKDYLAARVAHKLDLSGPAVSVHTACSTSLVAVCQAVDALRAGRCEMALAGGVSITCPPASGYRHQEGAMLSPDGRTRPFDAAAQGTVFSDGAGVVLLKRLADAIADGDTIHAVIRGVAVNNDGAAKASFTAPNAAGQAAVIAAAHADAGIDPRTIAYVEAHGTATPLGDPIEIEGLTRAFRANGTGDGAWCWLGSVKANIGHTVIAAGVTGLIRAALAVERGQIPPLAHFERSNPAIDLLPTPFRIPTAVLDWPATGTPRRAGVSSFGVGGTNAHVVLEQAPPAPPVEAGEGPWLLPLSARTPEALARTALDLARALDGSNAVDVADVAHTLVVGRRQFARRLALVAATSADAARGLERRAAEAAAAPDAADPPPVVLLFPGQGAQYAGMGRELYRREPVFRAAFDRCAEALGDQLSADLRTIAFDDDPQRLLPTALQQPAVFALSYALACWWRALGVEPVAVLGHSVGEFVAATIAGVFEPERAIRLVAERGRLMQAQPPGAMLSVRLAADALAARLPAGVALAADNGPAASVAAGPAAAIEALAAALAADGIACRALRTSHAFHSPLMQGALAPFRAAVADAAPRPPSAVIVSSRSAATLDAAAATSIEHWATQLVEPVRFGPALAAVLAEHPRAVLLECGPRATLTALARPMLAATRASAVAVASLADAPALEPETLLGATGQLWCRGVALALDALDRRARRRRIPLPTYPFARDRHWVEAGAPAAPAPLSPTAAAPDTVAPILTAPAAAAPTLPEEPMPIVSATSHAGDRRQRLMAQLTAVLEDVSGIELGDTDPAASFVELGLDSLTLTQVALQLQKQFKLKVSFRQLMESTPSRDALAAWLEQRLPADPVVAAPQPAPAPTSAAARPVPPATDVGYVQQVIQQQMQIMAQQLALLGAVGSAGAPVAQTGIASPPAVALPAPGSRSAEPVPAPAPAEGDDGAHTRYDVKKAFGAIARIHSGQIDLTERQRARLDAFIRRYCARTAKSKEYTERHRARLADPRVVNGFRPLLKEIVYQIVIARSKGARLWDLDGNEYVDALNGFGMSLFGWQPEFVLEAVRAQLEQGYEIGPQHPLAGEVAERICRLTGFDRAALCNTGSEAVLGAIRIARTVTGRTRIAMFSGAYHGINDEVIVRASRGHKAVPAAPGIMRSSAENVLVLDYGTPEALEVLRAHADDLAAVLVEPVQSRRPDLQPREFLEALRRLTRDCGALLVFDEVVTGFRAHPRGAQAVLGIDADLATYGKVVGGGFPIGVIAGRREFMDALDGGDWRFGDDSVPSVGVTYFAGTFVRHPLALAAARAVLAHLEQQGPALQERLNGVTARFAAGLNAFLAEVGAPIAIKHFASVWKTQFSEDHPLQDLLFAMMRSRGVHILDNFPCFFTTAHSEADVEAIAGAYRESVLELQEAGFLPRLKRERAVALDPSRPPVPGARLGRDPDGRPAWFIPNPDAPGKYLKVDA